MSGWRDERISELRKVGSGKIELRRLQETVEERHRRVQALEKTLSALENELGGRRRVDVENVFRSTLGVTARHFPSQGDLGNPWWPVPNLPTESLIPSPGFSSATSGACRLPTVAVSVFGREGHDLELIISLVSRQQHTSKNFAPVFLTNTSDHRIFHHHGYPFAYFPARIYGPPEQALTSPRYRLLASKWGFTSYLDLRKGVIGITDEPAAPGSAVSDPRQHPELPPQKAPTPPAEGGKEPSPLNDVELIRSSGLFEEDWYRAHNPELELTGADPIRHYLDEGARKDLDPSPLFQTSFYVGQMAAARRRRSP